MTSHAHGRDPRVNWAERMSRRTIAVDEATNPANRGPGTDAVGTAAVRPRGARAIWRQVRARLMGAAILTVVSAASAGEASGAPALSDGNGPVPAFRHVYLIVMENREADRIVGNPKAPYINGLIERYGLAASYTAVAHPSEPNYLALFSGSTQGVTDDALHDLSGETLADRLEAQGRDWRVYAQNVPPHCFRGAYASAGEDGRGTYARKHNPAISFSSISGNPRRCAKITDFDHFDPAASDFALIVPNLCNDMHDCSTRTGDRFLEAFLPRILDSPAMADSVLFLTWDEGTSMRGGGGRVATLVMGPRVRPGFRSDAAYTHYSLLRTIEDAWGLKCLALSCSANNLSAFFR